MRARLLLNLNKKMIVNPKTPEDLIQLFKGTFSSQEAIKDSQDLRYVLYARKSTESAERQIRSLDDQIKECREFADRMGFKIYKIIKESESAKEPGIRPQFKMMLEDINKGKYDAILAWHPDRLARNMKEAGEIIDLLDQEIIKALKFVSFTFDNSASGKMLLGIAFVLSKEYSDKLSDDVKRGIKRSLEEGKYIHHPKKGYYKDRNQYLRPDGENFTILKEAFQMRLGKKPLWEIASFINGQNFTYQRKIGGEHRLYKMTEKRISEILRDPFYAGVLIYGDSQTDLAELYDFVSMVSVDDFLLINKISDIGKAFKSTAKYKKPGAVHAALMGEMIICAECGESMTAGITPKKLKDKVIRYYYFRCDTEDCDVYGKSTRANILIEFAKDFLKRHPLNSKKAYDRYVLEMKMLQAEKLRECEKELSSSLAKRSNLNSKFESTKETVRNEQDASTKAIFKKDLVPLQSQLEELDERIRELKKLKGELNLLVLDYSSFLELFGKLPDLLGKVTHLEDLDFIIRKIFLNFTIKDKKVASFSLNHPFSELFETDEFLAGRGTGN